MPNLSLVVCGAPLAARTEDLVSALESDGWLVTLLLTSAASSWLDHAPAPTSFRRPGEAKQPPPDAVVVCPLSFNTGNKWAAGLADTPVLSLLCEALGGGWPSIAVPFFKVPLWSHPAWSVSLRRLQESGVRLIDPADGSDTPRALAPGAGDDIARGFDPSWVVTALRV